MSDSVEDFLSAPEVERVEPASESELQSFQAESGLTFPPTLARFYRASNGARIEKLNLTLLPLGESLKYVESFRHWEFTERWGYFAFTDANDSDPHCVCCNATRIQGRIVLVRHDDDETLAFRSIESFLNAILTLARSPKDELIDDLKNDYGTDGNQTEVDAAAGIALFAEADQLRADDSDRAQMYQFGIALLPDAQVADFARLLNGDPDVCKTMLARLRRIPSLPAKTAISDHLHDLKKFCERAVEALRSAGVNVETLKEANVLIQPKRVWMRLDLFFEARDHPDTLSKIVKRAKEFTSR